MLGASTGSTVTQVLSLPAHPGRTVTVTPIHPGASPCHCQPVLPSDHSGSATPTSGSTSSWSWSEPHNTTLSGNSGDGSSKTATAMVSSSTTPQTLVTAAVYSVVVVGDASGWIAAESSSPSTGDHTTAEVGSIFRSNVTDCPVQMATA